MHESSLISIEIFCDVPFNGNAQRRQHIFCCITMTNEKEAYCVSFPYESEVIPMRIGEAARECIIQLCQEQDISINKLSNISGVPQSTVNNIVSGRNRSATISTIKKLCDGFGITV